jgi:ribose-phosphate pyrophosphokinase
MKQYLHIRWSAVPDQTFVLNLDPTFDPIKEKNNLFYLKHKSFNFLGGEPHFQITTPDIADLQGKKLIISQRVLSVSDLFTVILAVDAARRMNFNSIKLILPYFPAARQDRVCNEGEPLTLKIFTDMINQCNFEKVFIFSPHSEVTPALLNNVEVVDELEYAEKVIEHNLSQDALNTKFNIVCPDAGAGKRVGKIVSHLANKFDRCSFNLIRCEKIRDVKDGSLKDFFVQANDLQGLPTIIFDDVLSLGGTFIGLGDKLRAKNCGKLMLFTAHADCQQGIERMINYFDWYYTTDSRHNEKDYDYDKFTVFEFKL